MDDKWERPDLPIKCTFSVNKPIAESPHKHLEILTRPRIANNALDLIGNTPLVRLGRIAKEDGIECELLAKCEFLNVCGSVKDRVAKRMVEDAEKSGKIHPGDTLIEPTSGNTGIGLAAVAAAKGYRCIIVMPEKMSKEKEYILHGLGAEIVRTRTSANFDDPDSHMLVAEQLRKKIGPSAHILNQYTNSSNPLAHFDHTAEEIIHDCTEPDGTVKLDMLVASAGTGGTVTGISRKLKIKVPNCQIVAADPVGSILANMKSDQVSSYEVEGIGYDFVPTVLDRNSVDKWCKVNDNESFSMARRLLSQESLPCGGSSGSAVAAAIKVIKEQRLGKMHRVVVILPDSIRNYMTKFLTDNWLYSRGFLEFPLANTYRELWINRKLNELLISLPETVIISQCMTIKQAINQLKTKQTTYALIMDKKYESVLGVFDSIILQSLLNGSVLPSDDVKRGMNKNFRQIDERSGIEKIARELILESYVVLKSDNPHLVTREAFLQWSMSLDS